MTAREEWCTDLARRLHAKVARDIPAGVGAWEPSWAMVEQPSRDLMDELALIEAGQGLPAKAVHLAERVHAAWMRAGREWQAKGRAAAA